jgi:hypothetical protein
VLVSFSRLLISLSGYLRSFRFVQALLDDPRCSGSIFLRRGQRRNSRPRRLRNDRFLNALEGGSPPPSPPAAATPRPHAVNPDSRRPNRDAFRALLSDLGCLLDSASERVLQNAGTTVSDALDDAALLLVACNLAQSADSHANECWWPASFATSGRAGRLWFRDAVTAAQRAGVLQRDGSHDPAGTLDFWLRVAAELECPALDHVLQVRDDITALGLDSSLLSREREDELRAVVSTERRAPLRTGRNASPVQCTVAHDDLLSQFVRSLASELAAVNTIEELISGDFPVGEADDASPVSLPGSSPTVGEALFDALFDDV